MSTLNSFNMIAPCYDSLKRIIFGTSIFRSQVHFLHLLKWDARILILGGGTGEILKSIIQLHPDCEVWFVEASSKMLSRAVKNAPDNIRQKIRFIHGTENSVPRAVAFDAVITNFFLDLFPDKAVSLIAEKLGRQLHRDGVWLIADFVQGGKWWHRLLLRMMYRFFVVTCRIEAEKLPSWDGQLRLAGFSEQVSRTFYGGFIRSSIYHKTEIER